MTRMGTPRPHHRHGWRRWCWALLLVLALVPAGVFAQDAAKSRAGRGVADCERTAGGGCATEAGAERVCGQMPLPLIYVECGSVGREVKYDPGKDWICPVRITSYADNLASYEQDHTPELAARALAKLKLLRRRYYVSYDDISAFSDEFERHPGTCWLRSKHKRQQAMWSVFSLYAKRVNSRKAFKARREFQKILETPNVEAAEVEAFFARHPVLPELKQRFYDLGRSWK